MLLEAINERQNVNSLKDCVTWVFLTATVSCHSVMNGVRSSTVQSSMNQMCVGIRRSCHQT